MAETLGTNLEQPVHLHLRSANVAELARPVFSRVSKNQKQFARWLIGSRLTTIVGGGCLLSKSAVNSLDQKIANEWLNSRTIGSIAVTICEGSKGWLVERRNVRAF